MELALSSGGWTHRLPSIRTCEDIPEEDCHLEEDFQLWALQNRS